MKKRNSDYEPTECLSFACPMRSDVCEICRLNPERRRLEELHEEVEAVAEVLVQRYFRSHPLPEPMAPNNARQYVYLAAPAARGRALYT